MKIFELLSDIAKLTAEYIELMSDPKESREAFGDGDFDELCFEPGNCAMISNHFEDWLRSKGVNASAMTGIHAKNPSWAKNAHVTPLSDEDAHTVVLIDGDTVVDLTARQFDKQAKFPKITSYQQFKAEWVETD